VRNVQAEIIAVDEGVATFLYHDGEYQFPTKGFSTSGEVEVGQAVYVSEGSDDGIMVKVRDYPDCEPLDQEERGWTSAYDSTDLPKGQRWMTEAEGKAFLAREKALDEVFVVMASDGSFDEHFSSREEAVAEAKGIFEMEAYLEQVEVLSVREAIEFLDALALRAKETADKLNRC
jgi:hypothetical protein